MVFCHGHRRARDKKRAVRATLRLTDEEHRVFIAILDGALQRADYALMEVHPAHPHRSIMAGERRVIVELLRRLGEAE
jgi:hypothetical protein